MVMEREDLERVLRSTRPQERNDFAQSRAAQAIIERTLASPLRGPGPAHRMRRHIAMVAAGLAIVATAGAAAVVVIIRAPSVPSDWVPPSGAPGGNFVCADAGLSHQAEVPFAAGESPIDACRRSWPTVFGRDAPQQLFACVVRTPTDGGPGRLMYILDGDEFQDAAETCGSVNMFVAPEGWGTSPLHPTS